MLIRKDVFCENVPRRLGVARAALAAASKPSNSRQGLQNKPEFVLQQGEMHELESMMENMSGRAEKIRNARVHWLAREEREAERLLALYFTRPLTGAETRLLLYEDGTSGILGYSAPPSVCWRALRRAVRARAVVVFWLRVAVERLYAPGGPGRIRDTEAFQTDLSALFLRPATPRTPRARVWQTATLIKK